MWWDILAWIDRKIFRCQWIWLCDYAWEHQIARDAANGTLDLLSDDDIGPALAKYGDH